MKMIVSFDVLSPDALKALVAWGETVGVQVKEFSEREYLNPIFTVPAIYMRRSRKVW
jgi:long-chain acyl-CoA synthetase